ncbi:hypothetical protein [Spiroplasma endosymbiont of Acasis viretata]|uniref:hypothetical protein n=1 Tax=Spiroplasma endosymbiont of Acasis viretata TaxID=3066306 RepID=UPI00313C37B7
MSINESWKLITKLTLSSNLLGPELVTFWPSIPLILILTELTWGLLFNAKLIPSWTKVLVFWEKSAYVLSISGLVFSSTLIGTICSDNLVTSLTQL